jgi:hypothetical protein
LRPGRSQEKNERTDLAKGFEKGRVFEIYRLSFYLLEAGIMEPHPCS